MEYQENNKKISPFILTIAMIQAVFVIIIIITIYKETVKENTVVPRDDQPIVTIDDLSLKVANLSDNYINDILHSITKAIESNNNNVNVSNLDIIIRNDSITLKQFDKQQFDALSFIIDIPTLEQSYQVYYKYPTTVDIDNPYSNNPRAVLCIDNPSQIIYPNFQCHSDYPSDIRFKIARDYISFLKFDTFSISIDKDNPSQINLKPFHRATTTLNESHITQVKTTIESLGISPDIFTYQINK